MCSTTCGVNYYGMYDGVELPAERWSCDNFKHIANNAMLSFHLSPITDIRFATACDRVNGYDVFIMDTPSWWSQANNHNVAGLTYCEEHRIQIGNADPAWDGSLSHELAHAVQDCNPLVNDTNDPQHAGWADEGISAAIDAAQHP